MNPKDSNLNKNVNRQATTPSESNKKLHLTKAVNPLGIKVKMRFDWYDSSGVEVTV